MAYKLHAEFQNTGSVKDVVAALVVSEENTYRVAQTFEESRLLANPNPRDRHGGSLVN